MVMRQEVISLIRVPFGEKRFNLSPKAFLGEKHYLFVRVASREEIHNYRNLAVNVMDQFEEVGCYPHVLEFEEKRVGWVKLSKLIKSSDPSPFPALSQIQVFGRGEV